MTKKKTALLCVCVITGLALCAAGILFALGNRPEQTQITEPDAEKEPSAWEEYLSLSPEQQEAFFEEFDSVEDFEAWIESVKPVDEQAPIAAWEKPGKAPDQYRWEEYQELTMEEQEAFFQWFDSEEAFRAWLEEAQPEESATPEIKWNKPGKTPDQYTWEEYQALSAEDRDAFYLWFASTKEFETWMTGAKPVKQETAAEWNKPGKTPDAYTWEEYQALSTEEQEAFYLWFASAEEFEAWMTGVKPVERETEADWNKPGKKPDAYTWDEYLALSTQEQDAFFRWFASEDAFEAWMTKVQPEDETLQKVDWDKPGKMPDAYTWEEYQALTAKEQDAFYQWFSSMAEFEAWMESAKPEENELPDISWEKPGKKPDAYTWDEYQALGPEEQEAFYLWFGSEDAFEAWMTEAAKD